MAKSFMALHFKKKTRRIDKSVTVGTIERIGKIVEKFSEHSVSNIVHPADNYNHFARPRT